MKDGATLIGDCARVIGIGTDAWKYFRFVQFYLNSIGQIES